MVVSAVSSSLAFSRGQVTAGVDDDAKVWRCPRAGRTPAAPGTAHVGEAEVEDAVQSNARDFRASIAARPRRRPESNVATAEGGDDGSSLISLSSTISSSLAPRSRNPLRFRKASSSDLLLTGFLRKANAPSFCPAPAIVDRDDVDGDMLRRRVVLEPVEDNPAVHVGSLRSSVIASRLQLPGDLDRGLPLTANDRLELPISWALSIKMPANWGSCSTTSRTRSPGTIEGRGSPPARLLGE